MPETQYDRTAAVYEDSLTVLTYPAYVEDPTYTAVIGDVTGRDVLDLGSGTGVWTRRLKQAGAARVEGVEQSAPMVDASREKERQDSLGVTYHVADVAQGLPEGLADGFDVATGINVLHYSSSRAEIVGMCTTARSALREGGRFIATCANYDMPDDVEYYRQYGLTCTVPADRVEGTKALVETTMGGEHIALDFYLWRPETYADALRVAGFTSIRWHDWQVSAEGIEKHGAEHWERFLNIPSIHLVEAFA